MSEEVEVPHGHMTDPAPEPWAAEDDIRCPHGTVETPTTKCRDCIRERAMGGGS